MDARSFAQVALRLLATFMIFSGLAGLPIMAWALMDHSVLSDTKVDPRVFLVSAFIPMILGVVIWMASPRLASWMVGKDERSGSSAPLDVTQAQTVAFVVFGVWLAIRALSKVLVFAANWEWSDPFIWEELVELALSLFLIAGAKSLARFAQRVREFGAAQDQK